MPGKCASGGNGSRAVADDVTHGLSAIVLLAAAIYSHKASLLALTAFGRYDGCDAAFLLIDGFINHKPLMRTGRHGALKSQRELNLRRRQSR